MRCSPLSMPSRVAFRPLMASTMYSAAIRSGTIAARRPPASGHDEHNGEAREEREEREERSMAVHEAPRAVSAHLAQGNEHMPDADTTTALAIVAKRGANGFVLSPMCVLLLRRPR